MTRVSYNQRNQGLTPSYQGLTPSFLFRGNADVGAGLFESGDHLFGRNHAGVVDHRIDLAISSESAGYAVNPGQPLQGGFADAVSMHEKDDSGPGCLLGGSLFCQGIRAE